MTEVLQTQQMDRDQSLETVREPQPPEQSVPSNMRGVTRQDKQGTSSDKTKGQTY